MCIWHYIIFLIFNICSNLVLHMKDLDHTAVTLNVKAANQGMPTPPRLSSLTANRACVWVQQDYSKPGSSCEMGMWPPSVALFPKLSTEGADRNTHPPDFLWKGFDCILSPMSLEGLAPNQPASRCWLASSWEPERTVGTSPIVSFSLPQL